MNGKLSLVINFLLILASIFTLYIAKDLFLPIVLAFLLYFLLYPIVNALWKLWIPKFIGSFLVLFGFSLLVGFCLYFLSDQIREWVDRAPSLIDTVTSKLKATALVEKQTFVSDIILSFEYVLNFLKTPNFLQYWLNTVFSNLWQFFIEFGMMLILLYFFLSSENFFLKKLIKTHKKEAHIILQIEDEVWGYLFIRTMTNIGVAIVVSLMLWAFQLPNPILWGVIAGILEFIPFIGACISLIIITIVSVISLEGFWHILAVPLSFFVFIALEGNLFIPYVLGQKLVVNNVAIVLSIFLFGWIWGVMGAFLAVPLMMTIKIIYDNINKDNRLTELFFE